MVRSLGIRGETAKKTKNPYVKIVTFTYRFQMSDRVREKLFINPFSVGNLAEILQKPLIISHAQGLLWLWKFSVFCQIQDSYSRLTCWHSAVCITKVSRKKSMPHTFLHLSWMSFTGLNSTFIRKISVYFELIDALVLSEPSIIPFHLHFQWLFHPLSSLGEVCL